MSKKREDDEEVHRITSAPEALAADQARRAKRYLAQMGVRVVCFIAAVLTWHRIPIAFSILMIVAAVVLPYIAVLFANAGRARREPDDPLMDPRTLGPGHRPGADQLGGNHR
ncbi:DUF3099 domain-containing protein [Cellulomonas cellasea]|uniref:DUF3099 domain-containing protein n=1 Tax=Cellulomonas cellasea TaxID=43670 RepID=UPI0025A4A50E|nr:DUF3099 domain-containing protein [Cellulomonas cellasea]MDM8085988.1 DUF3099 domain-containing protein [Cellulomonas cellasea]